MAGNVFFATFYPTLHNTTYRISIAAVNREGQGVAVEANVTTPPQQEQDGVRWVFASRMNSLRKQQDKADMFTAAECLSDTLIKENITGVAEYHMTNHVYFSEGTRIWEKSAGNLTDHSDLRLVLSGHAKITALTVDWLYRKLYYVSDHKVRCCKLEDCSHGMDFNLNLESVPRRIIADPYNGWLFLLLHDGIHRIPLPEFLDHASNLTLVLKTDSVHDFVVSFSNRRLIFYDKNNRTLSAVSMDGLLPIPLYSHIKQDVQSVAYENDLLVLTDGHAVYKQSGNGQVGLFTEFSMDCDIFQSNYGGFGNVRFLGPSSQPCPVPRQPRDLQVLFGSDKATLRWNKPKIQNGSSSSAWQNWTYSVKCFLNGLVISEVSQIAATYTTVRDLQSVQQYVVSVWAVSPGGSSHTVMFQGTTLQPDEDPPYIAGATADKGIWRQQLDSFDFLAMLTSSVTNVKDMDWYNNTIFWTNSSGHIGWIDAGDHSTASGLFLAPQSGNLDAHAIAFDWLGRCLYWSCNTNMICRGRLSGSEVEIVLDANRKIRSILIDSVNAAIYWSTDTTLEVCRFDGERRRLIEKLDIFSGRKIAGITANWRERRLYWLIQDGSFLHLYSMHTSSEMVHHVLKWSSSIVSNQQVAFYSGRLVWLDEAGKLRIQELNQTSSVVMSPNNTLTTFAVLQKFKTSSRWFCLRPSRNSSCCPQIIYSAQIQRNRGNDHLGSEQH
ncbi:proto-oncogene tyrosine-protein kinase ROS [Silurus meridionalis]|uniref:proto-oncogene tyrosine-protein kinase ROS n=1 Tax=Silurus meridionalis TaxID=175797 RepID=UPI001EEC162E|nr:proto-oncogene tyrosine-protein kinase ROS [Silurus meridionalis]